MKNVKGKFFKVYDRLEVLLALLVIGAAVYFTCTEVFSCDFFKNPNLYLNTTDALPIYSKVNYAVECLKNGDWPSWFPYWYCGTSVTQYYPPLTYIILAPIEFLLKNDNAVLQIYIFLGLLCGGMGIWLNFKRFLGRFWGIFAGALYVMLPFFRVSFFSWGVIAQIPIVALAPWYLYACFELYQKKKWYWWLSSVFLCFLLLASHVMHGFMVALCVFVAMLGLSIVEKKSFSSLFLWAVGAALSAGLLGVWWVTGVLPLENPGVPYLAPETAVDVTANWTWFFPEFRDFINKIFPAMKNSVFAYFPFFIIFIALISVFLIRKQTGKAKSVLLFVYIQTVFSFVLSFGLHLPLFRYLPLARQLVPGRILTQTAIGAAILTAFVVARLVSLAFRRSKEKDRIHIIIRAWCLILVVFIIGFIIRDYRHEEWELEYLSDFSEERGVYSLIADDLSNFEKGRVSWYSSSFSSAYAYFAEKYDFNIVSGWNLEGTTLADYLRYQNTALYFGNSEYLLKKIYDMNVQYCFLTKDETDWFGSYLQGVGFVKVGETQKVNVLKREDFAYFLEHKRNALVIGKAANLFLSENPWFVKGHSTNPADYSEDYFDAFDYVYYCEPEIDDMAQVSKFERQVMDLAKKGKKVFVELGRTDFPYELFGVYPNDREVLGDYNINSDDELDGRKIYTSPDAGRFVELFGLDNVLYRMVSSTGALTIDLVGTKKVEGTDVYFIGGPLSQLKSFAFGYLTGRRDFDPGVYERDEMISRIFDRLLDGGIYKELKLPAFEAKNVLWRADGCEFEYQVEQDTRVMASITYTPRWKVFVDGVEVDRFNMDNMLVFTVPKGSHKVQIKYGSTIYAKIGIWMTAVSFIIVVLVLAFYKWFVRALDLAAKKMVVYLELRKGSEV